MPTATKCVIDGCPRPGKTRGYCNRHYLRLHRHGDPFGGRPPRRRGELAQRIAEEVEITDSGCHLWTGSTTKGGYANGRADGRYVLLHRWLWEARIGPIPPGMVIDHRCHNEDASCMGGESCLHRRCLNLAHLQPVSNGLNILRSRRHLNLESA